MKGKSRVKSVSCNIIYVRCLKPHNFVDIYQLYNEPTSSFTGIFRDNWLCLVVFRESEYF